jgi:hypothetical protein
MAAGLNLAPDPGGTIVPSPFAEDSTSMGTFG